MPIAYVRWAFDHCLRFMAGYRVGLTGVVLEYAVKKYKSHRRLSSSINLESIENEYTTKKKSQMTIKRCKQLKFNMIKVSYSFYVHKNVSLPPV